MFYDEKGAVGRRYRRQDEIGTPFCITVDGQTLNDGTVTIRDRDSLDSGGRRRKTSSPSSRNGCGDRAGRHACTGRQFVIDRKTWSVGRGA